ncbi:MAG: DUF4386 domain-containing protein [Chloroflexi bacterium]|nr:DUF4386 domain-containing protein [Chloroflexota bacterium]
MTQTSHRRLTGILLIAAPILFMAAFTMLQVNFEYPDILRQPAMTVMQKFAAGGSGLIANWYAMVFSALLFIPIAVMLHPYLNNETTPYMTLATTFGVTAGIVQMLGFIRWPFLVPTLASAYLNPSTSEATRAAIEVTFTAFNQYAGVGIGEHLGYVFTSLWSILIGMAMFKSPRFAKRLGWMGMLSALGILLGTLEPAGVPLAGLINAMSYIVWAIWMVIVGVVLLLSEK